MITTDVDIKLYIRLMNMWVWDFVLDAENQTKAKMGIKQSWSLISQ